MRYLCIVCLLLAAFSCKDPYFQEVANANRNYLTVEGFIDVAPGASTTIRLTRTTNVNDTDRLTLEKNAVVAIEQNGAVYPFTEQDSGYYRTAPLNLGKTDCRLRITTSDGKEYASDDIQVKISPEIDTISWDSKNQGCQIYITSHDDSDSTRYYRWEYEETWEYHSPVQSSVTYDWSKKMLHLKDRAAADSDYRCFESGGSVSVLLGTTEKLEKDILYRHELIFIPPGSIKLSVEYSVLVKQYALTKSAYNYMVNVKKITEQLGDVLGPLPTELKGNLHCVNNNQEPVIGYITASTVTQHRVFISRGHDFPDWKYFFDLYRSNKTSVEGADVPLSAQSIYYLEKQSPCPEPTDPNAPVEPCNNPPYNVCCPHAIPFQLLGAQMNYVYDTICVDCIFWGHGGRKKPVYWPN